MNIKTDKIKENGGHKKVGRKTLFANGITPLQEIVALDLAMGKSPYDVGRKRGISYDAIKKWQNHSIFTDLIEKHKKDYVQKVKDAGILDEIGTFKDVVIRGLMSNKIPDWASVIRALENLSKIKDLYSPEKIEIKQQEELKGLSPDKLVQLLKERGVSNTDNLISQGSQEENTGEGDIKV